MEDVEEYREIFKEEYFNSSGRQYSTETFDNIFSKYDSKFFKYNSLMAVYVSDKVIEKYTEFDAVLYLDE